MGVGLCSDWILSYILTYFGGRNFDDKEGEVQMDLKIKRRRGRPKKLGKKCAYHPCQERIRTDKWPNKKYCTSSCRVRACQLRKAIFAEKSVNSNSKGVLKEAVTS